MRLLPPCLCIYVVVLSRSHDVAEFCVLFCQAGMLPMCFRRIMGRHFKDLLLHSNMESSVSLNHCSQRPTLCAPQQDVHISGYYPEGTTPNNSWGKMLQVLQHFLSMLHQAAKITSPTGRHGLTTQSHALLQQRQHILSTSTTRPLFPQPVPPTAPNLAWNVNDGRLCITTDNSHPSALQHTVHCFGTSTEQLWQRTLYNPNVPLSHNPNVHCTPPM